MFYALQAPFGMSVARRLGCHALMRWRQRMLRADNTSVIVIALPEPGKPHLPMHRDEVILSLAEGPHCDPSIGSRSITPLIKVKLLKSQSYTLRSKGRLKKRKEIHYCHNTNISVVSTYTRKNFMVLCTYFDNKAKTI